MTTPTMTSSETKMPSSINFLAFLPKSVPALIASLSILPVEICGILNSWQSTSACVPFPAPGGPKRIIFIYLLL